MTILLMMIMLFILGLLTFTLGTLLLGSVAYVILKIMIAAMITLAIYGLVKLLLFIL